jgi:hypothetical protein
LHAAAVVSVIIFILPIYALWLPHPRIADALASSERFIKAYLSALFRCSRIARAVCRFLGASLGCEDFASLVLRARDAGGFTLLLGEIPEIQII